MSLTNELHTWFRDNNGKHSTCCRVLTREFDMGQGEHKEQCIRFTGMCAFKAAEILCRELGVNNSAVRFRDGEPVETFHSMIDPGMHIPEMVSQINHITDDMVAGAPAAGEVMAAFDEFVGTDDIVGHNIDFDLRFIKSAGSALPDNKRKYFDTAELTRRIRHSDTGNWRVRL